MALPSILSSAVEKKISELSSQRLQLFSQKLSKRYRDNQKGNGSFMTCYEDYLGYLATRLPATYSAIFHVLSRVQPCIPDIKTFLDLGSGPGTGFWAAQELFNLTLSTLVEKDKGLLALGKSLSDLTEIKTEWIQKDLEVICEFPPHDLTLMAYSLGELSDKIRIPLLHQLWKATHQVLVLIEPGTPSGFKKILEARESLISWGAFLVAPCPHQNQCPLRDADWCHFTTRLPRSPFHQRAKQAELNYEDEKFSYVVFSRTPLSQQGQRVIRHPQKRSGHVELTLCSQSGIESKIISRKQKQFYHTARKLEWGSLLNLNNQDV
jgi:ribosomal protein RSM22 (predicted rRNA methylase)